MNRTPSKPASGFTLVELMTAVAITVILTGAMLGLTRRAESGAQRVTRDVHAIESWRDTLAALSRDVRMAHTVAAGGGRVLVIGDSGESLWTVRDGALTRSTDDHETLRDDTVTDLRVERSGAMHRIVLSVRRPGQQRVIEFATLVTPRQELAQ